MKFFNRLHKLVGSCLVVHIDISSYHRETMTIPQISDNCENRANLCHCQCMYLHTISTFVKYKISNVYKTISSICMRKKRNSNKEADIKIQSNPLIMIKQFSSGYNANPGPRGATRKRRNEGDKIWKKSLSGETTLTCDKEKTKR